MNKFLKSFYCCIGPCLNRCFTVWLWLAKKCVRDEGNL